MATTGDGAAHIGENLRVLITADKMTLRDVGVFAHGLTDSQLYIAATLLAQMLCDDGTEPHCRRVAGLLGAVMHRIVFEFHGVSRRPDSVL